MKTPEEIAKEIVFRFTDVPKQTYMEHRVTIAAAIRAARIDALEEAARVADMCASVSMNERPDAVHVAFEIRQRIEAEKRLANGAETG